MTSISVVIPVLNDARMLERCLADLAAQSRRADEIIVVDNGCTDDSAAVAMALGARVVREELPGIPAASARGFDEATGDIIARCDADSRLPPDWLERIECDLAAHPDAVAVTGPGRFYDLGPVASAIASVLYMRGYFVSLHGALANRPLFGSNCAVRASSWAAVSSGIPRHDRELHDDIDLSYRFAPTDRVLHDRLLVVGISGRPFRSASGMRLRFRRALHTMRVHGWRQRPDRRWAERVKAALRA